MSSALVAQGIEHGSPKAGVAGSNPAGGTTVFCRSAPLALGLALSLSFVWSVIVGHEMIRVGWRWSVARQRRVAKRCHQGPSGKDPQVSRLNRRWRRLRPTVELERVVDH
jgi:hypothetical protein